MSKLPARILIVDDYPDILTAARVVLRPHFETIETESNPQKLSYLINNFHYDVILLDMNYGTGKTTGSEGVTWLQTIMALRPQQRVIMITAYADIQLAVDAMKIGACDFIVKPWDNEKLINTVTSAFQYSLNQREGGKKTTINPADKNNSTSSEMIATSSVMKQILLTGRKVAPTDANVLLLGENGTGKELMAMYIHQHSMRNSKPFVKVDVGAISQGLFESEMFGHRKGAFTDARADRTGKIELANGGTLFLDEVGNLPLSLQSKLLSVLQNREVMPLGSNRSVRLDVRLICATNIDLPKAVTIGDFREDFLYRINTVEITLPPLRRRVDDIPALANHFATMYSKRYGKPIEITGEAMSVLLGHSWPGNIRELQHTIERLVIMNETGFIQPKDVNITPSKIPMKEMEAVNLDEMERQAILKSIERHSGNMSKVARELGVGRTTLYRKMMRYGIELRSK